MGDVLEIRKYKPGDLVRLKSGGPCMTVKYQEDPIQSQERYFCCWFDPYGGVQSAIFPIKALVEGSLEDNERWYAHRHLG